MKERVVIVSGLAGSGKSTVAKKIAEEFNLRYVSASRILKELREKSLEEIKKEKPEGEGDWWESSEGMAYVKQREQDMSFDRELDEELLKIIEEGNVVLDSKTMGYLSRKGFRIWLKASAENRAERVSGRDNLPKEEVLKKLNERDGTDQRIYKKLYGFDLGESLESFDLVLDTNPLNEEEVKEAVFKALREYLS